MRDPSSRARFGSITRDTSISRFRARFVRIDAGTVTAGFGGRHVGVEHRLVVLPFVRQRAPLASVRRSAPSLPVRGAMVWMLHAENAYLIPCRNQVPRRLARLRRAKPHERYEAARICADPYLRLIRQNEG